VLFGQEDFEQLCQDGVFSQETLASLLLDQEFAPWKTMLLEIAFRIQNAIDSIFLLL
jgi:hypothetical protein